MSISLSMCWFEVRVYAVTSRCRYIASTVLKRVYDYDPMYREDALIKMAADVMEVGRSVVRPDVAIIVATFPMGE